jgi:hypothetical protein
MLKFQIPCSTRICSPSSNVSDRYNSLKASWDSLMEAAEHGNPRSFYVAVTMVLDRLKREELKRKREAKEMKHTFASSSRHSAPCRLSLAILGGWVVK